MARSNGKFERAIGCVEVPTFRSWNVCFELNECLRCVAEITYNRIEMIYEERERLEGLLRLLGAGDVEEVCS